MRLISFMLTADQIKARTKTETRRLGWRTVKVGDRLRGVLKSQGRTRRCPECDGCGFVRDAALGEGPRPLYVWRGTHTCPTCDGRKKITEALVDLAIVEVTEVRRERLDAITPEAVVAEGFPAWSVDDFVAMFCKHMGCAPSTEVTVIRFRFVDASAAELQDAAAALSDATDEEEQ